MGFQSVFSLRSHIDQSSTSSNAVTPEAYSEHVAAFADALRSMELVDEESDARIGTYVNNLPKLCAAKQCQVRVAMSLTYTLKDSSTEILGYFQHLLSINGLYVFFLVFIIRTLWYARET